MASDAADVYLYDEIGMWGVTANDFARDLRAIKSSVINLHLNSPGGEVFDGIAIYNSLKNHPAAVNVFVDGLAASSASFIAQAGDTIVMAKNATMMIHEPYGMAMGDAATMTKMAEELNLVGETIADIYAERATDTTSDEWRAAMRDETWYKAQDAVDAGLADEVAGVAPKNIAGSVFNLSKFKHVPKWIAQAKARVTDAGRTMSQSNLDKLHSGMADITAAHGGACDMGADCPMAATANHAHKPRAARGVRLAQLAAGVTLSPDQLEQIDTYLDSIEANAEAIEATADAIEAVLGIEDEPEEDAVSNNSDQYRAKAGLIDMDLATVGGRAA